ncbi:GTP-binding protein [Clostridium sp. JNZ X4-2]
MGKTKLCIIGGFLGAGKTTLLWESARKLTDQGKRVGLITNDQASELVDTAFLELAGGTVSEVSGSCFCCNFNGFTDAISNLEAQKQVDIIIAEPVGSCTDLSATIMQPLKQRFEKDLIILPLTVLVDPERLHDILHGGTSGLHTSAAYIIEKQLEEADIIAINKTDLLSQDCLDELKKLTAAKWPLATILTLSAKNGEGLEMWLNEIMNSVDAGNHLAEVDYDVYAEGEAVLGWLNTTLMLQGKSANWDNLAEKLLKELSHRFDTLKSAVGHVKLLIETGEHYVIGNLTGRKESLNIRGSAGMGNKAKMILNARIEMDPADLERIVSEAVSAVCAEEGITQKVEALKCLSPGRPNPTHRYNYIVR